MPDGRGKHRGTVPETKGSRKVSRIDAALGSAKRASARTFARLPRPARLLWIFLAILGGYTVAFNLNGIGLVSLVALPVAAALTDIAFQRIRFRSVRVPDAAIATGMFLALLLTPTVPLLPSTAVVVAAITLRHALRYRERPFFNPAAFGVLLGTLVFGMAPAWWGSINVWLVIPLGIILTLRTPGSWRLPTSFLLSYAVLSPLGHLLLGGTTSPQVLILGATDPSILFLGLFMVSEPRTSPVKPSDRLFFGLYVGVATDFLPAVIPSLAPLVALLIGNVMAVVIRQLRATSASESESARSRPARRRRRRDQPALQETLGYWETRHRISAGLAVFAIIGIMAVASGGQSATPISTLRPGAPPPPPVGTGTRGCTQDNPNVASDVLTMLHQRLGPSVILSYDSNSGTSVFYDPVNKVTITETDLYEDFGYAEFNGDDYTTAGCSQ